MGMFDELTCKYPLPIEGANALRYQTKDTPPQFLDNYEIRDDGSLWHEAYELKIGEENDRPYFERLNKRWEKVEHHGDIRFYTFTETNDWLEFVARYNSGKLELLELVAMPPSKFKPNAA